MGQWGLSSIASGKRCRDNHFETAFGSSYGCEAQPSTRGRHSAKSWELKEEGRSPAFHGEREEKPAEVGGGWTGSDEGEGRRAAGTGPRAAGGSVGPN